MSSFDLLSGLYVFGLALSLCLHASFSVWPQYVVYKRHAVSDEAKKYEAQNFLSELAEALVVSIFWPIALVLYPIYVLGKIIKVAFS